MTSRRLILASASPRRAELLRNASIDFVAIPAQVEEAMRRGEDAVAYAERLAQEKARAVAAQFADDFILGADTVVVLKHEVLGKPRDTADAARMLRLLSGRAHQVTTGICLIGPRLGETRNEKSRTFEEVRSANTQVLFRKLTDQQIHDYVATGEPMDKAGAYAIQGMASRWIPRIDGCYFNVVGLPVPLVAKMLQEHGFFSRT